MKVAVCISGHMRKFNNTFPSLNSNLLSRYDCDVFISTWDKMGYSSAYKTDSTLDNTFNHEASINNLYNPKKFIIEDSSFIEELKAEGDIYAPHLKSVPKHVGHMASMFYKIYAANELRKQYQLETGVKYDWVIRCRSDLHFYRPIIIPNDKDKVYFYNKQSHNEWVDDQFAIGSEDNMDKYSSFYFSMPEYFKAKREYYPEKFMDYTIKKHNLNVGYVDFNFSIVR